MDDARPVLVVGATGKTGRAVCSALVAAGVLVRAAVRAGREPAAPAGTTPVVVDLATGWGLAAALDGARAAYHLAPNMHPDEVGVARRVASAAADVGLGRLVYHCVLHPDDARMPHHLRKAEAEALLREAFGTRLTVLRPAAYHQNLVAQAQAGLLPVPYSLDAPFTNVDLADVAEVAVAALGGAHAGLTLDLAGPEVLTTRQLAAQATAALGRPVSARRMSMEEWEAGPGAALDEQVRADLAAMFRAYDESGLVGDPSVLPTLLRRPSTTWTTCLARAVKGPHGR